MFFNVLDTDIELLFNYPVSDKIFSKEINLFRTNPVEASDIKILHCLNLNNDWENYDSIRRFKSSFTNWTIGYTNSNWYYSYDSINEHTAHYTIKSIYNNTHSNALISLNGIEDFNNVEFNALTLFSTDQLLLSRLLFNTKGALLHANCINIDDKTYLLLGESGAGKSTLSRLLVKQGAEQLSDDRSAVRNENGKIYFYGTWLTGTNKIVSTKKKKLNSFIILNKSEKNNFKKISSKEQKRVALLSSIIKPVIKPKEWLKLLDIVLSFNTVPFFSLDFNLDIDINIFEGKMS